MEEEGLLLVFGGLENGEERGGSRVSKGGGDGGTGRVSGERRGWFLSGVLAEGEEWRGKREESVVALVLAENQRKGRGALFEKNGFRVRFFVFFLCFQNCPP